MEKIKAMAAKLKDSFGIKIGDNEAQILDSLSKAKISRNLSYQYEIDETHIQSYIEELTFKMQIVIYISIVQKLILLATIYKN